MSISTNVLSKYSHKKEELTNSQLIIKFIQGLIKIQLESKEVQFAEDTSGEFIRIDKIESFNLPVMKF